VKVIKLVEKLASAFRGAQHFERAFTLPRHEEAVDEVLFAPFVHCRFPLSSSILMRGQATSLSDTRAFVVAFRWMIWSTIEIPEALKAVERHTFQSPGFLGQRTEFRTEVDSRESNVESLYFVELKGKERELAQPIRHRFAILR
jgi:hypothetical protein